MLINRLSIIAIALFGVLLIAGCTQSTEKTEKKTDVSAIYIPTAGVKIIQTEFDDGTYQPTEFNPNRTIRTQQFADKDDLLRFIKKHQGQSRWQGYPVNRAMDFVVGAKVTGLEAPDMVIEEAGNDADFSHTNNQVENVDEADLIKTDGKYIYTISNDLVYIIMAYPGKEAKIISIIEFDKNVIPSELFIEDNKLVVIGDFSNAQYFRENDFSPRNKMSFLYVYDLKDKKNPQILKDYKFEGKYFRARMYEGYVYIITNTEPEYRLQYPTPIIMRENLKTSIPISSVYYYNHPYQNPVFINIHSINMKNINEDINSKSIIVESSQNMYMSQDNIYFTYTEQINEWELEREISLKTMDKMLDISKSDKELIRKIKKIDDAILSEYEKEQKIMQIYYRYSEIMDEKDYDKIQDRIQELLKNKLSEYKYFEYSIINKVNVNKGIIIPIANAKIPGHIINQFSMDEFDGKLRIATTLNSRWSRWDKRREESSSNLFTLDENLNLLDSIKQIAPGEQIYSTRFIADRLYMVTFKQTDPFFVFDLSDPADVKQLGKLKIPGYSRYLHPYDRNIIIGIGRDSTEAGRLKGLKISLIDVSDVKNPKEIATYVADSRYSRTSAEYEHRAFLFSKEKELLVIPAFSTDYKDKSKRYNGAFVFRIKKDEIKLRGLIDHSMAKTDVNYWQPAVQRSLYINDVLYTKSENLLRINDLDNLEGIKNIDLVDETGDIKIY